MTLSKTISKYGLMDEIIETERSLQEFSLMGDSFEELNSAIVRDTQKLLIPELINEEILTVAEEARIARSLCQYQTTNTDSITWMKERGFEAVQLSEGAEIESRKGSYEKFTLIIQKIGVRPVLTNEMVEDSRWDVMSRNLNMATEAMARLEDRITMNAMIQGVPNGTAIAAGVGGIGEVVSSHYVPMGDLPAGNLLNWKAIATGITLLRLENYTPDTLLIHPNQMLDLMTGEADFIGANERAYLTLPDSVRNSMINGTIGNLGGMNVIVSANMTAGYALMIDRKRYATFVERRPLTINNYDDVFRDMRGIIMTQRFAAAATNRDSGVLLYGGKTALA